jgi:threonine dehydratase
MKAALAEGRPFTLPAATTIGDGIAVRRAGDLTLPLVSRYVDDIVTVDEEEMANAILLLLEREKTVAEGAGAAPFAALLNHKTSLSGKRVVVLISGGNIDVNFLARIIERGLVKDGRLARLQLRVPDHPGALVAVMKIVAAQQANVVGISHDRAHYGTILNQAALDITLETRGPDHIEEITSALAAAGYRTDRIV